MKALLVVTGRGLGGDAAIALNVIKALEKKGVQCEIALDESAPGVLFKKHGYSWHKISIPQAGGHAATKLSAAKGALKLVTATFKARSLIKKINADFVIGVLGGGAIVGSVGAKLAKKKAFSLISTPLDSKVCPKFNECFIFPELDKFRWKTLPKNTDRSFYPLSDDSGSGDEKIGLSKLKEFPNFDENKKTIAFSSGSSIFKGMIDGVSKVADSTDDYNLVLVGLPLEEEYLDEINKRNIIYAGYIDWINHLFKFADLAVLTDDGVSIQEALSSNTPIVTLTHVKWGRYENMAGVFEGAIVESSVDDVVVNVQKAFDEYDELSKNASKYGKLCLEASDMLVEKMLKKVK
ncbi:glycosyltransferase [Methanobrevibacter sp.]|uniref:glycosyltransferase n=1 Tax=Methanobrevibacter sp. TaxID=66852 RepID=UPI0025EBD52A|nr:glycosyltransferase [Methanobrevibacter sp.]MBQ2831748.1 glycosyltransferase [Methanobrevibacter sp.]